jgi:hypothetical protein
MAYDPKRENSLAVSDAAGPNDKYWQQGLAAFQNGDVATTAIQKIWGPMFPANLNLVALIVGTLYGDTYYDPTRVSMNAQLLADDLSAATGKNPPDCLRAAQLAFSQWQGLFVRANFDASNKIPRPGSILNSPDVVLNGKTPLTVDQLIRTWNQVIWGPISGDRNLVYGRAASVNLPVPTTGSMKMFIVEGAINPPNPQSWTQLFTADSSGTSPLQNAAGNTTLQPGERTANAEPFVWTVPGAGHYCAITVAQSEFFTNDPLQVPTGNWNSMKWISNNGAAGWHNLDTVRGSQAVLKLHNLDGTTERFVVEAHCSNLPAGTEVSLESGDAKLATSMRSGVTRISRKEHVISADAELPGNYSGDVIVRFKTPEGQAFPENGVIEVRGYWSVPPGHRHYTDAVDFLGDTTAIVLSRPVRLYAGSFTLVGKL